MRILAPSGSNLIGNSDPVSSIAYMNTTNPSVLHAPTGDRMAGNPERWQRPGTVSNLRNTNTTIGLLYIGPIAGGGTSYTVHIPGPTR